MAERLASAQELVNLGFIIIFLGFAITLIAVFLMAIRGGRAGGKMKGGGAVLVGPIPIVFGTDRESMKIVLILAIVLTVILVAVTMVPWILLR